MINLFNINGFCVQAGMKLMPILFLTLVTACNKDQKLLKCPDGYDCVIDIIDLGRVYPCPIVDTVVLSPFPERIDDDSTYRFWFHDPHGCAGETAPDVDFITRTVIGTVYELTDANDEYKGCSVCINNQEMEVILRAVFKKPCKSYSHEGAHPLFLSIPKVPFDYKISYELKRY